MIANVMNAMLNEIKRGIVDNGVLKPNASDKLFMNNPNNIRKETLNPTDNTTFSAEPISFNFRT
jgi:hypothetical protein